MNIPRTKEHGTFTLAYSVPCSGVSKSRNDEVQSVMLLVNSVLWRCLLGNRMTAASNKPAPIILQGCLEENESTLEKKDGY